MNKNTRFVVMKHSAIRAKLHYDLRIRKPGSNMWMSFAIKKGIPIQQGIKHLAIQTDDHSEKDALFTGRIEKGKYGGGLIEKYDSGTCTILKMNNRHVAIDFKGNKIKGRYHMVATYSFEKGGTNNFLIFKGKEQ